MKTLLEVNGLSKIFNVNTEHPQTILKDVSLKIREGEFVSVMGPSGSGKSTLLYNVSGLDKATDGKISFDGQELTELSEKELSKLRLTQMGFVFQQSHLLKNLCILDNVLLPAYRANMISKADANKRAAKLLADTGISNLADHDITQASGGQLQRVGICRALINSPKILFGDEPTGALNSKAAQEVMEIFAETNHNGTTILLVTHDSKVAAKTERVLFMIDGNIVSELYLEKYDKSKNDISLRESRLSAWLKENGF